MVRDRLSKLWNDDLEFIATILSIHNSCLSLACLKDYVSDGARYCCALPLFIANLCNADAADAYAQFWLFSFVGPVFEYLEEKHESILLFSYKLNVIIKDNDATEVPIFIS